MIKNFGQTKRGILLRSAAAGTIAALTLAAPAQAIVPNDNFTPTEIIDNDGGVNGVGMFFRNDGFVCSGTLINPRAVLFAAHCVNDRPESDYGPVIQSAFSFDVNALPGFQNWIGNGFSSNPGLFVYNISQIAYNPDSVARPDGFGFLEGDIALATLADPAANIPTWALLFSPLPDPGVIDNTDGTGYHVNITGYGRSGSGTTGASQGIDWRRRAHLTTATLSFSVTLLATCHKCFTVSTLTIPTRRIRLISTSTRMSLAYARPRPPAATRAVR